MDVCYMNPHHFLCIFMSSMPYFMHFKLLFWHVHSFHYIQLTCLSVRCIHVSFHAFSLPSLVVIFILSFSCIRPCQNNILRMLTCCPSMTLIIHMLVHASSYCIRVTSRHPIECACISLHGLIFLVCLGISVIVHYACLYFVLHL